MSHGTPSLLTLTHGSVVESLLSAGDFVLIPAWTEYQIANGSEVDRVEIVVTGSGGSEEVVVLKGWGGAAVSSK